MTQYELVWPTPLLHHNELPEQIEHFTRDLEVNGGTIVRSMDRAYKNPPWK